MLPSIIKDLKPYQLFSNDDYVNAKKNILKHKQSTIKFNTILESAHDVNLNGDYTLARISHNYFNNCIFDSASLEGVAGTGCIFNNNKFLNSKIINAGFSSSTIEGCFFENCKLNNSNMSQCYIDNTILENCDLRGLNLSSFNSN